MPTIAVDAMGGDHAPDEVVKGAALVSTTTEIETLLVGDEMRLQAILDRVPYDPEHIAIAGARASGVEDAIRAVADGRADAIVSAGGAEAAIVVAAKHLSLLSGVKRPVLASVHPRQIEHEGQDRLALLVDAGATVRCDADELVQLALMANAWARGVSKVAEPRIGLLNMRADETTGGPVLAETHRRLRQHPRLHFVGNVTGDELVRGKADAVVCEGLLGSVAASLLRGMSETVAGLARAAAEQRLVWRVGLRLLSQGVERVQALTDYARYGGAPILGFERVVVVCHAQADARAIANAIKVAAKAVRDRVPDEMRDALGRGR
ncbi:MAG TPA: phosphate acyltransferase PlsX [Candidatus Eisenbacteria bacterium]|nr:phosphate acyltransferase PlsX [Candidatus Eisenbacteria bacterium]